MIRLRTLAPLNDVELDLISFVQTFVAIALNGAVMNEDVCSAFAPEKAVAFRVVEPLHRTLVLRQLSALPTLVGWAAGLGSGTTRPSQLAVLLLRQVDVLAALAPRPDATLAPGAPALYAVGTPLMANVVPESIFPRLPQRQPPVRIPHRGR